jgi:hypothetical protein
MQNGAFKQKQKIAFKNTFQIPIPITQALNYLSVTPTFQLHSDPEFLSSTTLHPSPANTTCQIKQYFSYFVTVSEF